MSDVWGFACGMAGTDPLGMSHKSAAGTSSETNWVCPSPYSGLQWGFLINPEGSTLGDAVGTEPGSHECRRDTGGSHECHVRNQLGLSQPLRQPTLESPDELSGLC